MWSMLHTSAGTPWALKKTARAMPHAFHKLVWELPLLRLQWPSGAYICSWILVVFGLHGFLAKVFITKVAMPNYMQFTS